MSDQPGIKLLRMSIIEGTYVAESFRVSEEGGGCSISPDPGDPDPPPPPSGSVIIVNLLRLA
ncbi:hypothetical protein kac65v162_gp191 [Nodularia phage vB_NspS-kac65v162]|jgi:hypothetical protein|uniref:Uncharacterized protein n=3 Tax=Ravarandavirus kac65v151 TaxID=2845689 RepID=A0A482MIG9_9CAUD|nr:hypothetical protein HWC12_gp126 [Nodularia phage vB_NspS-kac65v151]QBQ73221.1 hypothetical protein kac65v151_gp191 [Nodularia phage vB_NspS-kac65v151]QBQ73429.1 hypothetical protein kac65v161_gp191 [Nodularia phage vB_NspS-kac65v161]QBQ73635.1 hypothetical protein kac65v162_gp191 [Nodularia phage vB_NspS-kac65v162]